MTTAAQAFAAIRSRLESEGLSFPLRFQGDTQEALPGQPAPFAYVEFHPERAVLASFGGGRGENRYRNPARIDAYVFVPQGHGLVEAVTRAEQIAALFRSFRDVDISCFEASVLSGGHGSEMTVPGMSSEVNNYWYAAVEVRLFFDQIG